MREFGNAYRGKRVLITGHTGFKGSWLAQWLLKLGADVAGYSLNVPTDPSNFEVLGLDCRMRHRFGDIRETRNLAQVIEEFRPEIIFHMAAQALVRSSYADPVGTFETNTMGMVHLLECVRSRKWIQAVVLITSDKAYRNDEWCWGYREMDALGGGDPYSASKSCADLIAQSYAKTFFTNGNTRIAITRAGNVIGGGDWAADRVVPDCIRAWSRGESVAIRSPNSTRPWQHVLEPLSGYLWLGACLLDAQPGLHGEAFNFGPDAKVVQTVGDLLNVMTASWPGSSWVVPKDSEIQVKEAKLLKLSCDKVQFYLQWSPILDFSATVGFTMEWYRNWHHKRIDMIEFTDLQISDYCARASRSQAIWTRG